MNDGQAGFLAGAIIMSLTVFITTAVYVWRPRLQELIIERNEWRERALQAEDAAKPAESDMRIMGDWGSAYE